MTNPKVTLNVGWAELTEIVSVTTSRSVGMETDEATVVVHTDQLRKDGLAYCGEATISVELNGVSRPIFSGLVDRAEVVADGSAVLTLTTLKRGLENAIIQGFEYTDCDSAEIIYSLARHAGLPSERIRIKNWIPPTPETILVCAPLLGVAVSEDRQIGPVVFSKQNPARVDPMRSPIVADFLAVGAWVFTTVDASTLAEAEERGLTEIQRALNILRAFAYYSYPTLDDEIRAFDWRLTQARPSVSPITFVGSLVTPRRWIRHVGDLDNVTHLNLDELAIPRERDLDPAVPRRPLLWRALDEWRLSVDSSDDVARVTHLWRAIECYSAGVKAGRVFEPAVLDRIRETALATPALSALQRARIAEAIGHLNEAPLLVKLQHAMELDDVHITRREFDALSATRSLRNDIEHGRELKPAQHRQLDTASAITNRVLITALLNLG